jgi:hypothetical protein
MSAAATRAAATAAGAGSSSQKRAHQNGASAKQPNQGSKFIVKFTVGVALVAVLLPLVAAWFVSGVRVTDPEKSQARQGWTMAPFAGSGC